MRGPPQDGTSGQVLMMPNRIIKESICTSESVSEMTDFEFRLWVGLIVSVDDYGRGDARAKIIKGRVFPLRERVSVKDIECALHSLAAKGCVSLYEVDGRPYFWFPTWAEHQRIQTKKSKYPDPLNGISRNLTVIHRESPPESNPIQSESESESEYESNPNTAAPRDAFGTFWEAYPKKKSKGDAEKAWKQVKPDAETVGLILLAVEQQKQSKDWKKDNGQFIPYPATWLRAKGWEDEPQENAASGEPERRKTFSEIIAEAKEAGRV